jgi:outer membrane receptor protein involved in Fe transport
VLFASFAGAPALAQDAGGAAPPTPAPPAATELPPVDVIQKKAAPAQKSVQKKSAPKKKQVVAPTPQPPPAQPVQPAAAVPGTGGIDSGTVNMSPVAGSEIPIAKYPGAVGRASDADIAKFRDASVPEVLQNTVPGVVIGDAQGNIYQRNLQYRGFEASPVNGVPQGLAVYQNGVRINEAFGDIVNWDFLPDNAIEGITILGANPVYGLNALGGAVGITMRDGFNFQGVEIDSRFGSFGHAQGSLAVGARSGAWGAFIAGEYIQDDGYRDFSEAEIKRMYADIGVKGDGSEFHLNYTGASNEVGVTAAAPEQLLDLGWNRTFTSPQTTENQLSMVSLNGSINVSPSLTFSGVGYYRWFQQRHVDGNIAEGARCGAGETFNGSTAPVFSGVAGTRFLCLEEDDDMVLNQNGQPVIVGPGANAASRFLQGVGVNGVRVSDLGTIDRTSQDAQSYGGSLQGVDKTKLFGMNNQFLLGASYDHGEVDYGANSELGYFLPRFVVSSFPTPIYLTGPDDVFPRVLSTTNDYVGMYVSNTTDITKDFALTLGGRWNYARIDLQNENPIPGEPDLLTGTHEYYRFNPMAGATYNLLPGLTLYGGYSEANRAPTAAELACADPEAPCLIESFLTADPPLKQVVSRTFELGLRGKLASFGGDQNLQWTAGLFRTENSDDILSVSSPINGRGYFLNAGDTLRQGFEAGLVYQDRKWVAYTNYAFIDATFETANIFSSPDNHTPGAFDCAGGPGTPFDPDEPICIQVNPGDRLPGVPRHRFKIGADYWVTSAWRVGGDVLAVSDQVFFGDEGNDGEKLDGYAKVDIRTSYNVTENIQIYGMVDNLFDSRYGVFGNFFNVEAANNASRADGLPAGYFGDEDSPNNRTITPAPPVAAYGGVKVRY